MATTSNARNVMSMIAQGRYLSRFHQHITHPETIRGRGIPWDKQYIETIRFNYRLLVNY